MCTVVLTRFVCLFICFWCYLQLRTEVPLVITLVSSRLVSFLQSLGTWIDRGSTYSFTVLHRRTILFFYKLVYSQDIRYVTCVIRYGRIIRYLLRDDSHRFTRKRKPSPG